MLLFSALYCNAGVKVKLKVSDTPGGLNYPANYKYAIKVTADMFWPHHNLEKDGISPNTVAKVQIYCFYY